jgi:hypothetical protein
MYRLAGFTKSASSPVRYAVPPPPNAVLTGEWIVWADSGDDTTTTSINEIKNLGNVELTELENRLLYT